MDRFNLLGGQNSQLGGQLPIQLSCYLPPWYEVMLVVAPTQILLDGVLPLACWQVMPVKKAFPNSPNVTILTFASHMQQWLKEYAVILITSFYDINQQILRKKGYSQNFS